jgi:hypothetical protein
VAVTEPDNMGANRLTLLARAGELLTSPGAAERTLDRLAAMLVTGLASWCAIDVLDEHGELRKYVNVYVDGKDARACGGLACTLVEAQGVRIVAMLSGG